MSGEGIDSGGVARHEQDGRVLSGGTDAGKLSETMERHAPPEPAGGTTAKEQPVETGSPAPAASEPKPTRGQQRFSELAKARDTEKARADAAEARAAAAEAKASAPPPAREPEPAKPAATEPAKPAKPERFTYPSYVEAVEKDPALSYDQWELDRLDARDEWRAAKTTEASEKAAADKRQADFAKDFNAKLTDWDTKRDAFVAKRPDRAPALVAFLKRLDEGGITPVVAALLESEAGIEVADYLAGNQAEEQRIAALSPVSQAREIGKLEMKLASAPAPAKPAWTPPPAPHSPVNGNTSTVSPPSGELAKKGNFDAYRLKRAQERGVKPRY